MKEKMTGLDEQETQPETIDCLNEQMDPFESIEEMPKEYHLTFEGQGSAVEKNYQLPLAEKVKGISRFDKAVVRLSFNVKQGEMPRIKFYLLNTDGERITDPDQNGWINLAKYYDEETNTCVMSTTLRGLTKNWTVGSIVFLTESGSYEVDVRIEEVKTEKLKRKSIKRIGERISLNIICGIFIIYGITLIYPFIWLLYNSVKDGKSFVENPVAFPAFNEIIPNLENYKIMFEQYDMWTMFYNSLFLAVASPTVSIFCHMCTAYAYAKHEFKLKKALYILGITPMVVSVAGTLPTSYGLINDLKIYDNMYLWILTGTGGFGMNFLLLASVFQNISTTYREAAEMDGAGQWRTFLQIYVPQASGIITALWILGFIGVWNEYLSPQLYLPSYPTLSTGIKKLEANLLAGGVGEKNRPKIFAAMLITVMPVILIFIIFQEKIMNYSFGGGIKG